MDGPTEAERKILHLDLDAFYPSVETLDDPDLLGRPVIVGGLGPRGVVASASYEAREHGVHSAMPMAVARRLCPDAVYLRPRFQRYREISRRIFALYREWTDRVEPLSLDEAYLDVTRRPESAIDVARAVKARILGATGLTASAGVSVNKFLAKLASDMEKPDGLTVIEADEAEAILCDRPVEDLWGVGPATAARLRDAGFETIGQIAARPEVELIRLLGKAGRRISRFSRGIDDRPVEPPGDPKSISSETTFDRDLESWTGAWPRLEEFAGELEEKLRGHGMRARTLTLKVRYQDFRTITRSTTPSRPLQAAGEILSQARELMGRVDLSGDRRIRLVGLGVSNLVRDEELESPSGGRQLRLWEV